MVYERELWYCEANIQLFIELTPFLGSGKSDLHSFEKNIKSIYFLCFHYEIKKYNNFSKEKLAGRLE